MSNYYSNQRLHLESDAAKQPWNPTAAPGPRTPWDSQPYAPAPAPQVSSLSYTPFPSGSSTRLLDVDFTSWSCRHLKVTEGGPNGTLVYDADLKLRKPHMVFAARGTTRLPATVEFHTFSRAIDVNINGQQIVLRQHGVFKQQVSFESQALGGKAMTWKAPKYLQPFNLECRTDDDTLVARFIPHSTISQTKAGKLELRGPCVDGPLMDEVVVTGLAFAYQILTQTMAANAAAAS